MAGKYSVRKSSYGDLRGVEQFVMSARIALQVLSVIVDFNAWQKGRGAVGLLSVNEGMRSRARQTYLWVNRFILGIVVASPFTSLHDEVRHGNAIDFGITMPDGSNRALTAVEFTKLHALVEARGGTWTGVNFGEPWHHEMATRPERLAPYPDAAARAAASTLPSSDRDDADEQLRRLLMAFKDTLTIHQRIGTNGKDEDTYAISGPGVCAYLIRNGVKQPLALRIGRQLTNKEIRTIFTDEGAAVEKLPAATFDRRIAAHASLAELAQGKKFDSNGVVI